MRLTSCRNEFQHGSLELPLSHLELGLISGFTDPADSFEGRVGEFADLRILDHEQHAEPRALGGRTEAI